jgi:hypothetical protein
MQEVLITLRFNRVCLGAAKRKRHGQAVFCFERDAANRVMFMPAAWLACMRYAAKIANRHYAEVKKIDWCPVISGTPRPDWRRTIVSRTDDASSRTHYAVHEAFAPGETIGISAVLPDGFAINDFEPLLVLVGKYRGFSPFNNSQEKYGTFEVISVTPATGAGNYNEPGQFKSARSDSAYG